ncbi:flagellar FlbD family protein [Treponema pedis]|uniref:Flagellar protein-like protein n=2 Tax=Treponema pedis TaxID=409322 RepID=S6A828_9SPIR|nr:flagellar FlbD family protein [Treponema pedis]AGT43104.1 flagellar protein-like protein [Treponema pedis str. T A4]QOW60672.1 flagellar FlbD family protein [Treponema pedis]QSI03948.1 flagellar protein FlbD [Treponema pedis]
MIRVTRLNGTKYWINPHQIEIIECNPDVTLQMLSGKFYIVKETPEELLEAITAYRRKIGLFKNEL